MSIIDDYLAKHNLKYEQLTSEELAHLTTWLNAIQSGTITTEKIKEYISAMRDSVEQALIDEPEFNYIFIFKVPNRKQILLKARLKNYMLIEAYLSGPERAKKALEKAIFNIKPIK
jgi:hypothetical protein